MSGIKIITQNKKAFHDYQILETYEAGIALMGTEIKAIRGGKANLQDGWVDFDGTDVFLREIHIGPYSHGNLANHAEKRPRRLLLKKSEIAKLLRAVETKGSTVVPTKLYFKGRWLKVEIGVARGKKQYDKRESTKSKEADRQMARALKHKNR